MADKEDSQDLPADEHLRQDVVPEPAGPAPGDPDQQFLPGQTNAGQQVSGLASASGYGEGQVPDQQPDANNPV